AKRKGAIAMFGEKYGDTVRVVEMGEVSMEFCGGTHLDNTAKVGSFRIVSEGSVAAGVRRIEAVTGREALRSMCHERDELHGCALQLRTTPEHLAEHIDATVDEMREAKKTIEQYEAQESANSAGDLLKQAAELGGLHVLTATVTSGDAAALRQMGDVLRDKDPAVVAVLALVGEKVTLQAVCGKEAVARGVRAGDIIKAIAPLVGGKGGGKPDSAMGGGGKVSGVQAALDAVQPFVESKLG
nr:alanine--tRNA ligase [Oscillospiraceae bacterium]